MSLLKVYKDLPQWAKGVVIVGGSAAIYFAVRATIDNINRKKAIKEVNAAAELSKKELGELASKGVNPTYADSQYEVLCQKLVEAMNDCGTDEQKVYDVFSQIKNDADIRKLLIAFGVRYYRPCAASQPISYLKWLADDKAFGGPLPTWLPYDLSSSEIKKVNDILKKNGVNYTF